MLLFKKGKHSSFELTFDHTYLTKEEMNRYLTSAQPK